MPLTAISTLQSMRLQAGEAFVVQLKVDGGLNAAAREFVMSFYRDDRVVAFKMDGELNGDLFEFIQDGRWSESLYGQPPFKIEIAERMKNGRAVIATPTFNVESSAGTVEDFSNGVITRSAVLIKASFRPTGAVTVSAEQVLWEPESGNPNPDPNPTPMAAKFGSTTATWGSTALKFGATS